jgi:hypothetical protein
LEAPARAGSTVGLTAEDVAMGGVVVDEAALHEEC